MARGPSRVRSTLWLLHQKALGLWLNTILWYSVHVTLLSKILQYEWETVFENDQKQHFEEFRKNEEMKAFLVGDTVFSTTRAAPNRISIWFCVCFWSAKTKATTSNGFCSTNGFCTAWPSCSDRYKRGFNKRGLSNGTKKSRISPRHHFFRLFCQNVFSTLSASLRTVQD